jgi:hypothetical protein
MGGSLAADRAGFIAAAIIDIAFAILARARRDHSPLSVIAQRLLAPSPFVVLDRVIAALFPRHPVVTRRAETASAGSVSAASRTGSAVRPRRPILALWALQSRAFRPTGPEQPSPKFYRLLIHLGITRLFWRFNFCSWSILRLHHQRRHCCHLTSRVGSRRKPRRAKPAGT